MTTDTDSPLLLCLRCRDRGHLTQALALGALRWRELGDLQVRVRRARRRGLRRGWLELTLRGPAEAVVALADCINRWQRLESGPYPHHEIA